MNRSKAKRVVMGIVLWTIALLLAAVCFRSGFLKVTGNVFWVRDFHRWGYPDWFRLLVGVIEISSAALLVIPRMAGYGGALFATVMLGAMLTHYTHNEMTRLPFNLVLLILSIIIVFTRPPAFIRKLRKTSNTEKTAQVP